jgi:putative cell wall-binding protein
MSGKPKKWSAGVNATSDAMDIERGTFTKRDPKEIAETVEHDAERSTRRKATPYRSAMSMLSFYLNRGGKNLSAQQRDIIERAKEILRAEFGPEAKPAKKPAARAKNVPARAKKSSAAAKKPARRAKTS